MRVSVSGFSPVEIANVTVTPGTTTTVDVQLKVGAITETVEVSALPALVDSTPSNFATALQPGLINEIPLEGRDIQALVQLIPGVTQSSGPSGSLF